MGPGQVLPWIQLVIAVATIAGIAVSVYRGTLGQLVDYIKEIPTIKEHVVDVAETQDEIKSRQDDLADGMVAVSLAHRRDDVEPDPDAMAERLNADRGPGQFLSQKPDPESDDD